MEPKLHHYVQEVQDVLREGTADVSSTKQGSLQRTFHSTRLTTGSIDDHIFVRNVKIAEGCDVLRYHTLHRTTYLKHWETF